MRDVRSKRGGARFQVIRWNSSSTANTVYILTSYTCHRLINLVPARVKPSAAWKDNFIGKGDEI